MTTAAQAVAEARRLAPLIKRTPPGWKSPVNVQDWAPNAPRYSWPVMGPVDHCGLSMNTVEHNTGLIIGVDFPDMAWTPSGLAWFQRTGRVIPWAEMQAGDIVFFNNRGSGQIATHVGMATGPLVGGYTFPTIEFNVDITGQGRELIRELSGYPVAACRPNYTPPKPDPTPAVVATITALQQLQAQEDAMPLLIDLTDADGQVVGHRAYAPGLGWREPQTDQLTEANGWARASCPAAEWEAWSMQALGDAATMTDLTARRVKAIMAE